MKTKGLESGKNIMTLIKQCIKDKTGDENITFCQIRDKFNIQLHIGITNITKAKFELAGCHNMPDLPIYKAINASIAIPFIFEPVIINDDVYCDGGLLDNLPIEYILKLITNNKRNNSWCAFKPRLITEPSRTVIHCWILNKQSWSNIL
jgi:predicted acylesterase/phospholipase RssA